MTQVCFEWLNDGKPVELRDIPMAGDDELDRLTQKYARTIAIQRQSFLLQRYLSIISVKRVLDMGYAEKAHKAWLEALPNVEPAAGRSMFSWSLEDFPSEFETYFHVEIEQRYNVRGFEEANEKLRMMMDEMERETKSDDLLRGKDYQKERLVTDLFWRLKRDFRVIKVDGQEMPLSRENLRLAIRIPSDWNTYLEAIAGVKREDEGEDADPAERLKMLEDVSEEDVKKKSTRTAKSEKRSKTVTPSTSASGMASATTYVSGTPTRGLQPE